MDARRGVVRGYQHTRAGRRVLRSAVANAVASSLLHMSWPDADRARYVPAAREFPPPDLAELVTVDVVDGWMYTDRAAFRGTHTADRARMTT